MRTLFPITLALTALLAAGCTAEWTFDPSNPLHVERAEVVAAFSARQAARVALARQQPPAEAVARLSETMGEVAALVVATDPGKIREAIQKLLASLPPGRDRALIEAVVMDAVDTGFLFVPIEPSGDPAPWTLCLRKVLLSALEGAQQACNEYIAWLQTSAAPLETVPCDAL